MRELLRRAVEDVTKRLAFDQALRQRWLRGLGEGATWTPCRACGRPVEQGRLVSYAYCGAECAQAEPRSDW